MNTTHDSKRPASKISRGVATWVLLFIGIASVVGRATRLPEHPLSFIQCDELLYQESALDIAQGKFPRQNDTYAAKYPPLYPAVLAPIRLLTDRESFPWWARFTSLVMLALALIPTYRLARRLYSRELSLFITVVANLMAAQAFAATLMSENLFNPLFLWLTLAVVRLAERPTTPRALLAGVLLGLAILTKTLALCIAPAAVAAVWFGTRRFWRTVRVAVPMGIATALLVAPWQFRHRLFASEANVETLTTYWAEMTAYGMSGLDRYAYWLRVCLGHLPQALGPITAALGLGAALILFRRRDPAQRTLAMFAGLSWLGFSVMTASWIAQIEYYYRFPLERYIAFTFPLLTLLMPAALLRPRWPFLAIGALAVATFVLLYPAYFMEGEMGLAVTNTSGLLQSEVAHAFGVTGARAVYIAGLLLVAAVCVAPARVTVPVVLGLALAHQATVSTMAESAFQETQRHTHNQVAELGDWLPKHVGPNDVLVIKSPIQHVRYHVAQSLEIDFYPIGANFEPTLNFMARLDQGGRLTVEGHTGRILLLAREFRIWALPLVSEHGPYRLYEASAPIQPLGDLDVHGLWADRWAGPRFRLSHPAAPGASATVDLVMSYPPGMIDQPRIPVQFRYGATAERRVLEPGGRLTYRARLEEKDGQIVLEIEAGASGWYLARELCYRLDGVSMAWDRAPSKSTPSRAGGASDR